MEVALIGFLGVLFGVVVTVLKEWLFKRREEKQKGRYLAIRTSAVLDLFVYDCAHVVMDDGWSRGARNEHGYLEAQVMPPTLDFENLQGDWHVLPAQLAYRILVLPSRLDRANRYIRGAADFSDPPDFEEYFDARQTAYARLGMEASNLADDLRQFGRLPALEQPEWDPMDPIRRRLEDMEKAKLPQGSGGI